MKKEEIFAEGHEMEDLDALKDMYQELSVLPEGKPSAQMDNQFYSWLGQEKAAQKNPSGVQLWMNWMKGPSARIAAGIALFVMGWLGSTLINPIESKHGELGMLNAEVTQLKQSLVLTKMQQTSSVDRLQAVNMVEELNEVDDIVIQSLLTVLITDVNDNVRLAALESLLSYTESPLVREGLVRSISKQNSPLVQLRLAEVMRTLQDPTAIPEIQEVLKSNDLNYNVRTKYNETLALLI